MATPPSGIKKQTGKRQWSWWDKRNDNRPPNLPKDIVDLLNALNARVEFWKIFGK